MGDRAIALSDAPHQEELLLSIRNPNPLRTEKIDPQQEIGIVQVDFGHVDFRIANCSAAGSKIGRPQPPITRIIGGPTRPTWAGSISMSCSAPNARSPSCARSRTGI